MKKITILLAAVLFAATIMAQVAINKDDSDANAASILHVKGDNGGTAVEALYIESATGNVGIGTITPGFPLEVNGETRITVPIDGTGGINFGDNPYYGRDMRISGIIAPGFDGIVVTNELIIESQGLPHGIQIGDPALHFKYGDRKGASFFLDADDSQYGLCLYVNDLTAVNPNIVEKITLYEGVTIGSAYARTTLPPPNGLIIVGDVGIGTKTPGEKLDINGAMHLTPGSTPTTADEGDIYMDATTHKLRCYDGTIWNDLW